MAFTAASTGASGDTGRDADAANLSADATDKRRIVRSVHRGKIGNLHGNDVVEDSKAAMNRGIAEKLVGEGNPRLVNEQRRCRKQVVNISEDDLIQRLIGFMRGIEKGARRSGEEVFWRW